MVRLRHIALLRSASSHYTRGYRHVAPLERTTKIKAKTFSGSPYATLGSLLNTFSSSTFDSLSTGRTLLTTAAFLSCCLLLMAQLPNQRSQDVVAQSHSPRYSSGNAPVAFLNRYTPLLRT